MPKQYKVKTSLSHCYLVFSSVFFLNMAFPFSKYKIMLQILCVPPCLVYACDIWGLPCLKPAAANQAELLGTQTHQKNQ